MSDKLDLRRIATEQRNPRTAHIDELPTIEMVRLLGMGAAGMAGKTRSLCRHDAARAAGHL